MVNRPITPSIFSPKQVKIYLHSEAEGADHFRQFVGLDLKGKVFSMAAEVNPYEGYFYAIKDILGVDERTLKYYIKAMQERKKKVLFTYLEKVSALPKKKGETGSL